MSESFNPIKENQKQFDKKKLFSQQLYIPKYSPVLTLPDEMNEAITEVTNKIMAPHELSIASALTAASIALQGKYVVQKNTGSICPVSLNFITIAESGDRKTSVDNMFMQPFLDFEKSLNNTSKLEKEKYNVQLELWKMKKKSLLSEISKAISNGEYDDDYEEDLLKINQQKPKAPDPVRIIYRDATPEAIITGLNTKYKSIGLISNEGASLFSGHSLRNLAQMNCLWDGQDLIIDRKTIKDRIIIQDAKLTLSLMTQRQPFIDFHQKKNKIALDIGFFARSLISAPISIQGKREIDTQKAENKEVYTFENLENYLSSIKVLFQESLTHDSNPIVIKMDGDAQKAWTNFFNSIEYELGEGKRYNHIRGFASKIGENTLRIAAIFHVLVSERDDLFIKQETMEAAISLGSFYLYESSTIFSEHSSLNQDFLDGVKLLEWLKNNSMKLFNTYYDAEKSKIRNFMPIELRKKSRLDPALGLLAGRGFIQIFNHENKEIIKLLPPVFTSKLKST